LNELNRKEETIGLLKYAANERVAALLFWENCIEENSKSRILSQLKAFGMLKSVFQDKSANDFLKNQLIGLMSQAIEQLPCNTTVERSVEYLMEEVSTNEKYVLSSQAKELAELFNQFLKTQRKKKTFTTAIFENQGNWDDRFNLIKLWLNAFLRTKELQASTEVIDETAFYLLQANEDHFYYSGASVKATIDEMRGEHALIVEGAYELNYNDLITKLISSNHNEVQWFNAYKLIKKDLTSQFQSDIGLDE